MYYKIQWQGFDIGVGVGCARGAYCKYSFKLENNKLHRNPTLFVVVSIIDVGLRHDSALSFLIKLISCLTQPTNIILPLQPRITVISR